MITHCHIMSTEPGCTRSAESAYVTASDFGFAVSEECYLAGFAALEQNAKEVVYV